MFWREQKNNKINAFGGKWFIVATFPASILVMKLSKTAFKV